MVYKKVKKEGDKPRKNSTIPSPSDQKQPENPSTTGKASKWKNRERLMVFCSRGVSYRDRHLMKDILTLLPHSKSESKMDKNVSLTMINEICDIGNCRKCLYFECKKKQDVYLWASATEKGPSVKFLVHNVHTMGELRLTGNCLRASRPVLSFESTFQQHPHMQLIQELFTQIFATPKDHPKSQPFIDHVFHFGITKDEKIWIRNYQIVEESGELEEIGPRLVLEIIKVFDGSFGGEFLYENPLYTNPNVIRRQMKSTGSDKYIQRIEAKKSLEDRRKDQPIVGKVDPLDEVFQTAQAVESADDGITAQTANIEAAKIKAEILSKKKRGKTGGKNKKSAKKQKLGDQIPASSA